MLIASKNEILLKHDDIKDMILTALFRASSNLRADVKEDYTTDRPAWRVNLHVEDTKKEYYTVTYFPLVGRKRLNTACRHGHEKFLQELAKLHNSRFRGLEAIVIGNKWKGRMEWNPIESASMLVASRYECDCAGYRDKQGEI